MIIFYLRNKIIKIDYNFIYTIEEAVNILVKKQQGIEKIKL